MKQMKHDKNFVRHLAACETMGGATNICSDKTGTLTENRMTVVEGWIAEKEFNKETDKLDFHPKATDLYTQGVCSNSTTTYHTEDEKLKIIGNPTEGALLQFSEKLGVHFKKVHDACPVVKRFGFTSDRKRMSTLISLEPKGKKPVYRLHVKGASEIILKYCVDCVTSDGKIKKLDGDMLNDLYDKIDEMAGHALRTIGVAYRDFDEVEEWPEPPEKDLTLIAIIGIEDPLRPEVPEAVATCQRAGIFVRMVTGDNIKTAKKIAEECGILTEGGIAMEGPAFRKLKEEEIDEILPRLQVLARSSPQDKYNLVHRLRVNGEVVAVTGDGTNDAPALKEADVGLSMGIAGTEVAQMASDIIILDDNFASIVKSVLWGRTVFDNIKKFLQFQLTVNVVALVVDFIASVAGSYPPLKAVQLLWVNLIMDSMAALALGTEKPNRSYLNRKPYGRSGKLLDNKMMKHIGLQAIYQILVCFVLLWLGDQIFHVDPGNDQGNEPTVHYTIIFNTFVFCQIFNEFNARKIDDTFNVFSGLFSKEGFNWIFCLIVVITVIVQILFVTFGDKFTSTTKLSIAQWFACVAIGFVTIPLGFLFRLIPVPLEKFEKGGLVMFKDPLAQREHRVELDE
eukprot:TRINITY_DN4057_c0_g1_i5.p1 TRINITY_DN4057_c0_g1~~TRINITY_DN4057_c0_g1_i5.p1  ORF type:complete len:646 (-),score=121.13 TRINITY_DN4057_c0_g1_i5:46-1914(-)